MAPPYQHHIFICTNRRPEGHPRGSCADKGGEELRAQFKAAVDAHKLRGTVRANAAGCLDVCEQGICAVVYPEGVWYKQLKPEDVETIVQEHLVEGRPVERLRYLGPPPKKSP